MVFENLTLFELHMEGSRFGPDFGGEEEAEEAVAELSEGDDSGGRGRGLPLFGLLVLAVVAGLAFRRYRSGEEEEAEAFEEESDEITIEHTADQ